MVQVDAGSFLMGSEDQLAYPGDGEGPVREVTISPFDIAACIMSNQRRPGLLRMGGKPAAHGGRMGGRGTRRPEGQVFPWGDDLEPGGEHRMKVWQGDFPSENAVADGYYATRPVDAFPANGYGLDNTTGNTGFRCASDV